MLLAAHVPGAVELAWQVLHTAQAMPLPKYPALQAHDTLSQREPSPQAPAPIPLPLQTLQGAHESPSPKYPALHAHATVSLELFLGHGLEAVAFWPHCLHGLQATEYPEPLL